jgi:hypothetical protein
MVHGLQSTQPMAMPAMSPMSLEPQMSAPQMMPATMPQMMPSVPATAPRMPAMSTPQYAPSPRIGYNRPSVEEILAIRRQLNPYNVSREYRASVGLQPQSLKRNVAYTRGPYIKHTVVQRRYNIPDATASVPMPQPIVTEQQMYQSYAPATATDMSDFSSYAPATAADINDLSSKI